MTLAMTTLERSMSPSEIGAWNLDLASPRT
jgi:hypothetical protein